MFQFEARMPHKRTFTQHPDNPPFPAWPDRLEAAILAKLEISS